MWPGGRAGVGHGPQLAADVLARDGVGGQDPLRLPDQERLGAVDDELAGERRAHALAGGLVAQPR